MGGAGPEDLVNPARKSFGKRIAMSLLSPSVFGVCLKRFPKKWVSVRAAKSSKGMADFALRVREQPLYCVAQGE